MTSSQTMIVVLATALWLLAFVLLLLIQPGLLVVTGVVLFCGWQYLGDSQPIE